MVVICLGNVYGNAVNITSRSGNFVNWQCNKNTWMSYSSSCCTYENPCGTGEGDCDADNQCISGLECGTNNCDNFPSSGADCCTTPHEPECYSDYHCLGNQFCSGGSCIFDNEYDLEYYTKCANRYGSRYSSLQDAEDACSSDSGCGGLYDVNCDGGYYKCPWADRMERVDSSSSCFYRKTWYTCKSGYQIPLVWECDDIKDCPDGQDERTENCPLSLAIELDMPGGNWDNDWWLSGDPWQGVSKCNGECSSTEYSWHGNLNGLDYTCEHMSECGAYILAISQGYAWQNSRIKLHFKHVIRAGLTRFYYWDWMNLDDLELVNQDEYKNHFSLAIDFNDCFGTREENQSAERSLVERGGDAPKEKQCCG